MPYINSGRLGCRNSYDPNFGLGLSIPGTGIDLSSVESVLGLQSSDPVKDQQRISRLNLAYSLAVVGNTTPQSTLNGLSGAAYIAYIASNAPVPGGGTSSGSKVALQYAIQLQSQLQESPITTAGNVAGAAVRSPLLWGAAGLGLLLWATSKPKKNPRRRRAGRR